MNNRLTNIEEQTNQIPLMNARITELARVQNELATRITRVQNELGARITGVQNELGTRINELTTRVDQMGQTVTDIRNVQLPNITQQIRQLPAVAGGEDAFQGINQRLTDLRFDVKLIKATIENTRIVAHNVHLSNNFIPRRKMVKKNSLSCNVHTLIPYRIQVGAKTLPMTYDHTIYRYSKEPKLFLKSQRLAMFRQVILSLWDTIMSKFFVSSYFIMIILVLCLKMI